MLVDDTYIHHQLTIEFIKVVQTRQNRMKQREKTVNKKLGIILDTNYPKHSELKQYWYYLKQQSKQDNFIFIETCDYDHINKLDDNQINSKYVSCIFFTGYQPDSYLMQIHARYFSMFSLDIFLRVYDTCVQHRGSLVLELDGNIPRVYHFKYL